jgi:hypothetical protein
LECYAKASSNGCSKEEEKKKLPMHKSKVMKKEKSYGLKQSQVYGASNKGKHLRIHKIIIIIIFKKIKIMLVVKDDKDKTKDDGDFVQHENDQIEDALRNHA